jgi:hypothetical protein
MATIPPEFRAVLSTYDYEKLLKLVSAIERRDLRLEWAGNLDPFGFRYEFENFVTAPMKLYHEAAAKQRIAEWLLSFYGRVVFGRLPEVSPLPARVAAPPPPAPTPTVSPPPVPPTPPAAPAPLPVMAKAAPAVPFAGRTSKKHLILRHYATVLKDGPLRPSQVAERISKLSGVPVAITNLYQCLVIEGLVTARRTEVGGKTVVVLSLPNP